MKFLILSDMHGDFEKLDRLDEKFKAADAVIFGGDFSKFKSPETGQAGRKIQGSGCGDFRRGFFKIQKP